MKKIGLNYLLIAVFAIAATFTACDKEPPEEKPPVPELVKERYIAAPVAGGSRVDYSIRYTTGQKSGNEKYDVYYVYLGKVDMVPISAKAAQQHDGVGTIEFTYSTTEINEQSITESSTTTVSTTIQEGSSYKDVVKVETGNSGILGKIFGLVGVKPGYQHEWGGSSSTSEQTSKTNTYTTVQRWSISETETIKRTIDSRYPTGWYRYALFATCDVYVEVLRDRTDDKWYYEYSVFARPNTLGRAMDYNTTAEFSIGVDAVKLIFNPSIVEILSNIIPEFTVELEGEEPDGIRYIDGNGVMQIRPSTSVTTPITSTTTQMASGWYYVSGDVTVSSRIAVSGNVHIILEDGCNFIVNEGINVSTGNSLNIYSQSIAGNMGKLEATGSDGGNGGSGTSGGKGGNAGIGGNGGNGAPNNTSSGSIGSDAGTIIINGGEVTAKGGNGGKGGTGWGYGGGGAGSGIGGGGGGGGGCSTGIGNNGKPGGSGGGGNNITINGGTVIAWWGNPGDRGTSGGGGGGGAGAGIGGGSGGGGGTGYNILGGGNGNVGNVGESIGSGGKGGNGNSPGTSGGAGGNGGMGNCTINHNKVEESSGSNHVKIVVTYQ